MLCYTRSGLLNQPPLVFLHGFLGCKEDWQATLSHLEAHFCCYALDLPGHGESPFSTHVLTRVVETLDALDLFQAVLIGYSLGGRLALQLQETFPDRFPHLILISAHPGLDSEIEKKERWERDLTWVQHLKTLPLDEWIALWYKQPLFATWPLTSALLKRRQKQNKEALIFYLTSFSLAHQPKRIPKQALFLHGELDKTYTALASFLSETLQTQQIPQAGHALHLESPSACAQAIVNFLNSRGLLYGRT